MTAAVMERRSVVTQDIHATMCDLGSTFSRCCFDLVEDVLHRDLGAVDWVYTR